MPGERASRFSFLFFLFPGFLICYAFSTSECLSLWVRVNGTARTYLPRSIRASFLHFPFRKRLAPNCRRSERRESLATPTLVRGVERKTHAISRQAEKLAEREKALKVVSCRYHRSLKERDPEEERTEELKGCEKQGHRARPVGTRQPFDAAYSRSIRILYNAPRPEIQIIPKRRRRYELSVSISRHERLPY